MLEIVTYPDSVLRQTVESVKNIDEEIHSLIDDMAEVMYANDGVGLAAPQVGISKSLVVMDVGEGLISYVNPKIILEEEEKETVDEGCLSLPGIRIDVSRPVRITFRGLNKKGELVEMKAEGLLARTLQHEIDHLEGILIIDYASSVQRVLLQSKLKKLKKEEALKTK